MLSNMFLVIIYSIAGVFWLHFGSEGLLHLIKGQGQVKGSQTRVYDLLAVETITKSSATTH